MKLHFLIFCFGIGVTLSNPFHGTDGNVNDGDLDEVDVSPTEAYKAPNVKGLWDRFMSLIDRQQLTKFVITKMLTDPDAETVFRYLRGNRAKAIAFHVMNDPEYVKLGGWLNENGITTIQNTMNRVHALFGWDDISGQNVDTDVIVDGEFGKFFQHFMEELIEILPLNAMGALALDLYQSQDPAAIALIERLRDPGMAEAWHRLKNLPEVVELTNALIKGGIAVEVMIIILETFLGWA